MNKITIVGCCGAGKTYLSLALGRQLNIPVHHLDAMYWKPHWVESEIEEFLLKQEKVVSSPRWILDGNYGKTMDIRLQHADTIIFLDMATLTCVKSIVQRYLKYRNKTRPDMGGDNTENLSFEFLHYAWSFRRNHRPRIIRKLESLDKSKKIIFLSSRKAVNSFLHQEINV